jgi:hypothetical protein
MWTTQTLVLIGITPIFVFCATFVFFFFRLLLSRFNNTGGKRVQDLLDKTNSKMEFSLGTWIFVFKMILDETVALFLMKTKDKGSKAPNSRICNMNGEELNLYDLMNKGRPLVISFGSYT